jgi:hypothetical protein
MRHIARVGLVAGALLLAAGCGGSAHGGDDGAFAGDGGGDLTVIPAGYRFAHGTAPPGASAAPGQ